MLNCGQIWVICGRMRRMWLYTFREAVSGLWWFSFAVEKCLWGNLALNWDFVNVILQQFYPRGIRSAVISLAVKLP